MCMPNVEPRSPFTRRKEEGVGHNHTVPNSKVCVHVITAYVCALQTSSCISVPSIG